MYNISSQKKPSTVVLRKSTSPKGQPVYGERERIMNSQEGIRHLQHYGRTRYQSIEKPVFNKVQQRLYAEAVYGLTIYTPEQVAALPGKRRHELLMLFKRSQDILNNWKQEIVDARMTHLLEKLFPNSSIVKVFSSIRGVESGIKCRQTFKELGINQSMIAQKLVQSGILPADFFQLA